MLEAGRTTEKIVGRRLFAANPGEDPGRTKIAPLAVGENAVFAEYPLGRMRGRRLLMIVSFLCFCMPVLTLGCNQMKSKAASFNELATDAINHYYDTEPSCLWFEPVALPTLVNPGRDILPSLEALASQGLLTRSQEQDGQRFQLADSARTYFRPDTRRPGFGNLCYGKPRVQHIDSTMLRHDENFGDVTDVAYESVIPSAPAWTAAPAVQHAFPIMALEISRPLPHTATLVKTPQGWDVAIGPASALETGPAPR